MIEKRAQGYPLQYILKEIPLFFGHFYVEDGVFIPRPETEILIHEVLNFANLFEFKSEKLNILDLGIGSGIILISLVKYIANSYGIGIDKNLKALELAKKNASLNKVLDRTYFIKKDITEPEKFNENIKFDIIVSNPPYIPNNDIGSLSKEVLHDPIEALSGGDDGLVFYPYIFKWGKMHLKENGILGFEMGDGQVKDIEKIAYSMGFKNFLVKKDFNNMERVGIVWI